MENLNRIEFYKAIIDYTLILEETKTGQKKELTNILALTEYFKPYLISQDNNYIALFNRHLLNTLDTTFRDIALVIHSLENPQDSLLGQGHLLELYYSYITQDLTNLQLEYQLEELEELEELEDYSTLNISSHTIANLLGGLDFPHTTPNLFNIYFKDIKPTN